MPVTSPVPATTEAMPGALLLQVPSGVGLLNVVVALWHIASVPVIAPGFAFTVNTDVVIQPEGSV